MKSMITELASMADSVINLHIADAAIMVKRDGFGEADDNFAMLHRYFTAHLLHQNNIIRGKIISDRVGPISQSYDRKEVLEGYADQWFMKYVQLKSEFSRRRMLV
jgi:hypothetical protein